MNKPKRFIPTSITDYALNNVKEARKLGKEYLEKVIKKINDLEVMDSIDESFLEYYEELLFYFNEYEGIDIDKLKVIETKGVIWEQTICL